MGTNNGHIHLRYGTIDAFLRGSTVKERRHADHHSEANSHPFSLTMIELMVNSNGLNVQVY